MTSLSAKMEALTMTSTRLKLDNASGLRKLREELHSVFDDINTSRKNNDRKGADHTALILNLGAIKHR
jgi:hypothetical protein